MTAPIPPFPVAALAGIWLAGQRGGDERTEHGMSDIVKRAKAALEGVSDGPWRWEPSKYIRSGYVITAQNRTALHATDWNADYGPLPEQFNHADANFAAEARSLVPELIAEVERLRSDNDEYDNLLIRQGELLTGVVNAIRGNPPELTAWSHHDAAELARDLAAELSRLRAQETRIRELADAWWDFAGPDSEAQRVFAQYGDQKMTVKFVVERIRAALDTEGER